MTEKQIAVQVFSVRPVIETMKVNVQRIVDSVLEDDLEAGRLTVIGIYRALLYAVAQRAVQMGLQPEDFISKDGPQALEAIFAAVDAQDVINHWLHVGGEPIVTGWSGTIEVAMDEL